MDDTLSDPNISFHDFVKFLRNHLSRMSVSDMNHDTKRLYSFLSRMSKAGQWSSRSPRLRYTQSESSPELLDLHQRVLVAK
jgi:hypothetical protein